MSGINLNKNYGVCRKRAWCVAFAPIADYLDVPVKLVRILVVLSIFFGLAFLP